MADVELKGENRNAFKVPRSAHLINMSTRIEQYRSAVLTTANQLTILRIVFVPVFIILLAYHELGWALGTFVAAGITDVLDGLIARRFGQKTSIGAALDPLADKLLMTSSILILSLPQMEFINIIPRWLMILIIFTGRFHSAGFADRRADGWLARLYANALWQSEYVHAGPDGVCRSLRQLAAVAVPELQIAFFMTGLMTAFSGLHYLVRGLRQWTSE